jgi:hypothetical protein
MDQPALTAFRFIARLSLIGAFLSGASQAQSIRIDTSAAGRLQQIDGFGSGSYTSAGSEPWYQQLYFDDMGFSLLRVDLTPTFKPPYSDALYNSPALVPGPSGNYCRTYTGPADYSLLFGGASAPIAVMGPDLDQDVEYFDYTPSAGPGALAAAGVNRAPAPGDFKLVGVIWSPAPWLKVTDSMTLVGPLTFLGSDTPYGAPSGAGVPDAGTSFPLIWNGHFSGGILDPSDAGLPQLDDSGLDGGTGPTTPLTQFARGVAAFVRGYQNTYGVKLYALSLQHTLDFEEIETSCAYRSAAQYVAALKAVRAELDTAPDLAGIQLMGPEDEGLDDPYSMWQFGSGASTSAKGLQFLMAAAADPEASTALALYAINPAAVTLGSGPDASPPMWTYWTQGWDAEPGPGLPAQVNGFLTYGNPSWVTEAPLASSAWLTPDAGVPGTGAFSVAVGIQLALAAGQQSGWLFFDFADPVQASGAQLTDPAAGSGAAKYVAVKHFARYIQPGSVRVTATTDAGALLPSAFLSADGGSLTVVLVNLGSAPITAELEMPSVPPSLSSFLAVTSSESGLWQTSTSMADGGTLAVTTPGYGIVTLVGPPPADAGAPLAAPAPPQWYRVGCEAAPSDAFFLALLLPILGRRRRSSR